VGHWAWLDCIPEKSDISRREKFGADSPMVDMPELDGADYIIPYLAEVGPATTNGMALSAIGYSEIRQYAAITNTHLTPWDAHMIRHLSRVYVSQHHAAKKPSAQSPYQSEMPIDKARAAIEHSLLKMKVLANGN
jgi:hypothetical protein